MALHRLRSLTSRAPEGEHWCKGTHAIQIRDWVEAKQGRAAFAQLMAEHGPTPEDGREFLVSGWYDAAQLLAVIESVAAAAHISVESAVQEIARRNAHHDLTTVYRVFLRILSPQPVLSFLPRLWQQYFRFGTVVVLANTPGSISFVTRGISTRFVPWVRGGWRGFLPETIVVSGGKQPVITSMFEEPAGHDLWDVTVEAVYAAP